MSNRGICVCRLARICGVEGANCVCGTGSGGSAVVVVVVVVVVVLVIAVPPVVKVVVLLGSWFVGGAPIAMRVGGGCKAPVVVLEEVLVLLRVLPGSCRCGEEC